MPIERQGTCPGCGKPVRLTEDELVQKRGYCAICDTRFDIQPGMLEGGPFRGGDALALARDTRPPSGRVHDLSDEHGLRIRVRLGRTARGLLGLVASVCGMMGALLLVAGDWSL